MPPEPPPLTCTNCGALLTGPFCSACGEQQPDPEQLKLRTFARRAVDEITDLEHSKLLRTAWSLMARPGLLTAEFLAGRRQRYLGPLKFYLVVFALTFIAYTIYPPTAVYDLRTYLAADQTGQYEKMVVSAAQRLGLEPGAFIERTNERWQFVISITQLVYPVLVGATLFLLYRGRAPFFVQHLIFALHYLTFMNVTLVLFLPLYAFAGLKLNAAYALVSLASVAWHVIYLFQALRRVYQGSTGETIGGAIVTYMVYFIGTMVFLYLSLGLAVLTLFPGKMTDRTGFARAVPVLGRIGLGARGLVYLLVGTLAILAGLGLKGGRVSDQREALAQVRHWPLGNFVLWFVALGLAAYVAWRLVQIFSADRWTTRLIALVSGTIYGGIVASALWPLLGYGEPAGDNRRIEESTAWVLTHPLGWGLVVSAGVGVAIAATWQFTQAFTARFARHLRGENLSETQQRWSCWAGRVGYGVRGLAFSLVALFLLHAGLAGDAGKAGGMEEALQALAAQPLGWVWLTLAGAGLAIFGLWSMLEARYRSEFR